MDAQWRPNVWRDKPYKHLPIYDDQKKLELVEATLKQLPPLVNSSDTDTLLDDLAKACSGDAFILQAGDCAESFLNFSCDKIQDFYFFFNKLSVAIESYLAKPVINIGRIAGQFAKPRSDEYEIKDNKRLLSYKGDIINGFAFNEEARVADPERQLTAYQQSSLTLNILAELHSRYHKKLYTSHEALLLYYEEMLTRKVDASWYDSSAHMLWIGARTRNIDHGHVAFCSGIKNPIGIKCDASLSGDELLSLLDILNPENVAGRISLIVRFGADKISEHLPMLISVIQKSKRNVVWLIDPMHGNTLKVNGYKTRNFDDIKSETLSFFEIHHAMGSIGGGLHLEMTCENVTECLGGSDNISQDQLGDCYSSYCDPRLNAKQAMELVFLVAEQLKNYKNM